MCDQQALIASLDSDESESEGMKEVDTTEIGGHSVVAIV